MTARGAPPDEAANLLALAVDHARRRGVRIVEIVVDIPDEEAFSRLMGGSFSVVGGLTDGHIRYEINRVPLTHRAELDRLRAAEVRFDRTLDRIEAMLEALDSIRGDK